MQMVAAFPAYSQPKLVGLAASQHSSNERGSVCIPVGHAI